MNTKISVAALANIASQTGPCLTLLVPDHHPGKPESSPRTQLRTLIKSVMQRTVGTPNAAWPPGLESPIEELVESLPDGGGPGIAVYRTTDSLQSISVAGDTSKGVFASHPYVMPLLAPAFAAHDVLVLGLSTKRVRLLEFVDGACRELDLPEGIPESLADSGHDHSGGEQGENRTPAGPSTGNMAGVRFGTGAERESAREAVDRFCAMIDQGLRPILRNRPLLLAGVKEEIASYRRVSRCDSLMHTEVDGNIDTFTPAHIASLAQTATFAEYQRLGEQVLANFKEMRDRKRAIHGAREVLNAAAEGRVHQLCVRGGTEMPGPMEAALNLAQLPTEDLVNAAVVETLRKGGEIFVLPQERMPATESVCAILRY